MRRTCIIIIGLMVAVGGASAREISLNAPIVVKNDSIVEVSFSACVDSRVVGRGELLIFGPVITDGEHTVSLRPFAVAGRKAARSLERHMWAGGAVIPENMEIVRPGNVVNYKSSVPFQQWMEGADLKIELTEAACGVPVFAIRKLESGILPKPAAVAEVDVPVAEPETDEEMFTTGALMAVTLPFVHHISDYRDNFSLYDDERENSIIIYYRINSYTIEPDFNVNRQTLTNLRAAVELISKSNDSRVAKIVVGGFASPEGPFAYNDRLAWERAVSIKQYLIESTGVADGDIELFNGSADWQGLRILIAADEDLPDKEGVIDIIDNHPVWNVRTQTGRTTLLRNLGDGRAYRYMAENIFPKLRNGAFIRVYYDDM